SMQRIQVIDSHTCGEPTRVIVSGEADLGRGSLAERRERFTGELVRYRSAVVHQPRGSDDTFRALLGDTQDAACAAGVIYFNNVGCIGMWGHGTMGVMVTLAHLRRIEPGEHRIETPVGVVTATLHDRNEVSVRNVPSWRARKGLTIDIPGLG